MDAGVSRDLIGTVLQRDEDVLAHRPVDGTHATWSIDVSVDGRPPVSMILDNGSNEIYVQALASIDGDDVGTALGAVERFGTVGLVMIGDNLFLRSGCFAAYATIDTLPHTYRAVARAYHHYRDARGS